MLLTASNSLNILTCFCLSLAIPLSLSLSYLCVLYAYSERCACFLLNIRYLCRIKKSISHCIIRHSLRYFRHSGLVIYMSKLPAPSVSMPCDYRILQSLTKEQVNLVLLETAQRSHKDANELYYETKISIWSCAHGNDPLCGAG